MIMRTSKIHQCFHLALGFSLWSMCLAPSYTQTTPGLATAYQDDTHYYIENDVLKIAVLRSTGNLDGIIHKESGVNLQTRNVNNYPTIWGMGLNTPGGGNVFTQSSNAMTFSGSVSTSASGAALNLTWTGQQSLGDGVANIPGIIVKAQISVRTNSQLSYWTFEASGLGAYGVASIDFPAVAGIGPLGQTGADDILLTPDFKGIIYHNPTATVPLGTYPGGHLLQFAAFLDPSSGFYFATDDTNGYTKSIYWSKSASPGGDSTLNFAYTPSGLPAETVILPYNAIIGATQGDWYAPAEMYRSWAVRQPWTQQSRVKKVPNWLHDQALIRNTCAHGCSSGQPDQTYASVVQEWGRSDQSFGVTGLLFLSGWEQYGDWAYGDYFPPQEGWTSFDATSQAIAGGHLSVFPSALLLDTATGLYKSGTMSPSAMLDQTGKVRTTVGGAVIPGDTWAYMDFSTEPWRSYVVDVFQTLAQHHVDLIQFDSSMVLTPQPCYNPAHAHPPGMGGNWQTLGWIDLLTRTATAVAAVNPGAAFSAEEPAEMYLPYLAVHNGAAVNQFEQGSQYTGNNEPVPLFQYVYHGSILFDDFFAPPYLDGSYFRLALGRDLTWGQIPDYQIPVDYTPPLEPMAEAYLNKDISARTTYAKKFLIDGIMLPAPQITVPATPVTWITNFSTNAQATAVYPSVLESAWRAADGSIGIVMTNIAPGSVTFSLPIAYNRLQLPAGAAYTVQSTDGTTTATLDSNLVKDSSYSITVAPQQILLVLLTPKAAQPQISTGGVVLHASTSNTVSPGSLVDIYGANFASAPITAPSGAVILPVLLPAPLLYVGPSQIVAQVPGTVMIGNASVVVTNAGTTSASATLNVQQAAPSILTYGTNHAITQNSDYSLNSASNPAAAGGAAVVYLIGSGPVTPPLDDGMAAPDLPLSWESLPVTVTVGGAPAQVLFAGMAPGFVGLVQVNFYVPDLTSGDYPIQVSIGSAQSNTPVISVVH
jgi:uncharacterized protein (TIGR03437 family)